jgi:hypothetical protein
LSLKIQKIEVTSIDKEDQKNQSWEKVKNVFVWTHSHQFDLTISNLLCCTVSQFGFIHCSTSFNLDISATNNVISSRSFEHSESTKGAVPNHNFCAAVNNGTTILIDTVISVDFF